MCAFRQRAIGVLALVTVIAAVRIESHPSQHQRRDTHEFPRAIRPFDFIANHGHWDPRIDLVARHGSSTALVARHTLALRIDGPQPTNLSLSFERASTDVAIAGDVKRSTRYNFYIGNDPLRWRSNVAAYAGVVYRGLYPG